MGHDVKNKLKVDTRFVLQYHGAEPTRVKVAAGNAEKVPVKKGDKIKVSETLARHLLSAYANLWSLEGEEPMKNETPAAKAPEVAPAETQPEMMKHKITQEDLDNAPELVEAGVKVGDEVEIPENDGLSDEEDEETEDDEKEEA